MELSEKSFSEIEAVTSEVLVAGNRLDKIINEKIVLNKNFTPEQLTEKILEGSTLILKKSWINEIPLILILFLSIYMCSWLFTFSGLLFSLNDLIAIIFIPLAIFAALIHRIFNRRYYISSESVTITKGLLSPLTKRVPLALSKIKEVELTENIFQRVVNVGDLKFSTHLFDEPEISIIGIYNPGFYMVLLRIIMKNYRVNNPKEADAASFIP